MPEEWSPAHSLKEAAQVKSSAAGTLGSVGSAVQRAREAVQSGDWAKAAEEIARAEAGLAQAWRQTCAARDLRDSAIRQMVS